MIQKFNPEHTCNLRDKVLQNISATTSFVCEFTAPKLVNYKRRHTLGDIIEEMKVVHGVDINYMKAWRTKERAVALLRSGPADGYRQMPRYIYMLKNVYPNSHVAMHKSWDNRFMYLFIALHPMIKGF